MFISYAKLIPKIINSVFINIPYLIFYIVKSKFKKIDKKTIKKNIKTFLEVNMDKKAFFENIRKEASTALSKVFDKVEEVSKISALKLKISGLKARIRDQKTEIGNFVYNNQKEFKENAEIQEHIKKIKKFEKEIEAKKILIAKLKEKDEEKKEEDINTPSM